jgi:hypothetical protein
LLSLALSAQRENYTRFINLDVYVLIAIAPAENIPENAGEIKHREQHNDEQYNRKGRHRAPAPISYYYLSVCHHHFLLVYLAEASPINRATQIAKLMPVKTDEFTGGNRTSLVQKGEGECMRSLQVRD